MNFLAHAYLSGNNEKVLLGNFMGDFIKGKKYTNYDPDVGKGVLLHREIDHFTDDNEIVSKSKIRLRNSVSHYAGVVVDIFYDHFLVRNWESFSTEALDDFINRIYSIIKRYDPILPDAGRYMIPFMIEHNWLLSYGQKEGLQRSLRGISKRSRFHPPLEDAMEVLNQYYEEFEQEFMQFFPHLIKHCKIVKDHLSI
jgi:acyl carrier protein phosphodiesterase